MLPVAISAMSGHLQPSYCLAHIVTPCCPMSIRPVYSVPAVDFPFRPVAVPVFRTELRWMTFEQAPRGEEIHLRGHPYVPQRHLQGGARRAARSRPAQQAGSGRLRRPYQCRGDLRGDSEMARFIPNITLLYNISFSIVDFSHSAIFGDFSHLGRCRFISHLTSD